MINCDQYTGWDKNRFIVVCIQNTEFILALFINYCIIFHMNNCKPTSPTQYHFSKWTRHVWPLDFQREKAGLRVMKGRGMNSGRKSLPSHSGLHPQDGSQHSTGANPRALHLNRVRAVSRCGAWSCRITKLLPVSSLCHTTSCTYC